MRTSENSFSVNYAVTHDATGHISILQGEYLALIQVVTASIQACCSGLSTGRIKMQILGCLVPRGTRLVLVHAA
jgi:hypothetical protein